MAAFDAFLKIDGIDGESTKPGHEKWIELYSFSWGASAMTPPGGGPGGGAAAGKVSIQPFSFMKETDSASPKLFLKVATGKHFDKVSLSCRKSDSFDKGNGQDYLKVDFYDVFFTSYNEGGDITTSQLPMESLSLNFSKIEFVVTQPPTNELSTGLSTGAFDFKIHRAG